MMRHRIVFVEFVRPIGVAVHRVALGRATPAGAECARDELVDFGIVARVGSRDLLGTAQTLGGGGGGRLFGTRGGRGTLKSERRKEV
jgi:hypothetical protein